MNEITYNIYKGCRLPSFTKCYAALFHEIDRKDFFSYTNARKETSYGRAYKFLHFIFTQRDYNYVYFEKLHIIPSDENSYFTAEGLKHVQAKGEFEVMSINSIQQICLARHDFEKKNVFYLDLNIQDVLFE